MYPTRNISTDHILCQSESAAPDDDIQNKAFTGEICVVYVLYMCGTCVVHVWYTCGTCVVYVWYIMRGIRVVFAWYTTLVIVREQLAMTTIRPGLCTTVRTAVELVTIRLINLQRKSGIPCDTETPVG